MFLFSQYNVCYKYSENIFYFGCYYYYIIIISIFFCVERRLYLQDIFQVELVLGFSFFMGLGVELEVLFILVEFRTG